MKLIPTINIKIFYHRLQDRVYIRVFSIPKGLTRYGKKEATGEGEDRATRSANERTRIHRCPRGECRQPVVTAMWVSRGATARRPRGSPRIDGNGRAAITLRASGSAA